MASVRSTIDLVITGATRGLAAASAEAEAMASRVSDAEDRVSAARTRSAAAEERVGAAEGRLTAARAQQEAALSRIGVAETNLERVRATSNESATRLSQAEADLDRVRQSGSTQQIEAAEGRVNQVRTESDRAAANLQRAEAQLATARANGERASARVAEAETGLNRARSDAVRASEAAARAEGDLNNLRRRGNQDTDTQRSGLLGLFDSFSRLRDAVTGADDASNKFLSTGSALQGIFSQIGGPIVSTIIGIVQLIAVLAAAGEVIGVVGGLIGQALAGVPALLVGLGLAAATALLGMDGIKKAAEAAAPAFDKLKKSVSDVFITQLTPFFQRVGQVLLPQVTKGFDNAAVAVASVAKEVLGFVTSSRGIADINTALAGTSALVRAIGPGIATFVKGLLEAASSATPAMQALGTAIGDIFGKIGDVFTKLAGNGVIQKAVAGLASVIEGLANVLAPVISLLIQMGAALGDSVGQALTSLGAGIEQVTPFFVDLARVAGVILVDAFKQLGPPISALVDSILPGAANGMDGFASLMHNVVLPAIAGFINWLRTDGIPGFIAFTQAVIINTTSFASGMLAAFSGILSGLEVVFAALSLLPGPMGQQFGDAAKAVAGAKVQIDGFKASVDAIHDKEVKVVAHADGTAVQGLHDAIASVNDKTVTTISKVFGFTENQALKGAIDTVYSKGVATVSAVAGRIENDALTAAIDRVHDTTKKSTSNVFGEPQNKSLLGSIDALHDKTVTARANAVGEDAVRALQSAMNQLHDVTVHVTTVVKQIVGFRSGGRVPTSGAFLVGEDGPELLTLDGLGGVVTPSGRTAQILAQQSGARAGGSLTPFGSSRSDAPITVNVMLSQDQIAGIAQVEIQRRDRATRRTVLAGSGATF